MYYVFCCLFFFVYESCSLRVVCSMGGLSCREIFSNSIDCSFFNWRRNKIRWFKVGFMVTTWTILFLSIGFKDLCQRHGWFYQMRIGSRRNLLFGFR